MALTLTMEQKQVVSQKMIQSATILQMTSAQLNEYINELSLENPVLEIFEKQPEEFEDKKAEKYQWLCSHDEQNRYLYQKMDSAEDEPHDWEINDDHPETLHEHLWSQLLTRHIPARNEEAYHFLLDSLDSNGYFTESLSDFASRFGLTDTCAENMLFTIQQLAPPGVGARSLSECLCIQLQQQGLLTPPLRDFIENYLPELAKNHLPAIAHSMKLPLDTIKEYCGLIKSLTPKPGSTFSDNRNISYITPDIIVVKFRGHFDILLNESLYPDIKVNAGYAQMYKEQDDKEVKSYLLNKIHQTEWVKQCIAQRNQTLFRVAQAVFTMQEPFFINGNSCLKPLRLIDVADSLEIHESTVSRAIRGKYLQCSWGIFPLSFFFQKAAPGRSGGLSSEIAVSPTVTDVKDALREIIRSEDKKKPYSDQRLSELLTAGGFSISRRTVAKYRDEEKISSASGRREY